VTAQIRALEKDLGTRLVRKDGRGLALTEAGERVYAWAHEVLAGYTQVQRDIDQLAAGTAGSLTVHASIAIGTYLLPPVLTDMRAARPEAEITVRIAEPTRVLRAITNGEADFGLCAVLDQEVPGTLTERCLWDEPFLLGVGADNPDVSDSVTLTELAALPMVAPPSEVASDQELAARLRHAGLLRRNIMIRLGHSEAIKRAAVAHGWCCLLPGYVMNSDIADGRMRAVPIRDLQLTESIGLYYRKTKFFSPLQQAVIDQLCLTAAERRGEKDSTVLPTASRPSATTLPE
jgi:DNA-binding transcriptional LysR family regulator